MTDLVITAASVVPGADAVIDRHSNAGEAIVAGKWVYLDPATKKWLLADSNSAVAAARLPGGVAISSASLNQPVGVVKSGSLTMGVTMTAGLAYYLSDTPGGMCPVADIGSGEYVCLLGLAASTTVFNVDIQYPNVVL